LVDLVKKKNQLDELAIALKEETEGKSTKGSAKGGKKGKRKRAGGGTKPRPKKRKDTNETSEVTEIGKGLKTKWRQLETSDLTELALVDTKDTPKLGRQSKYVHALQTLAEQVMLKRVNNKESWIVVGLENADDFLEVARAITNLNSITQLAKQVKYLIEDRPGDFESAIAENELHDDCYDQTGGLTNIGNIVKLGIDIVRIETNDTTRRIRHRYNCVKIANFYEKEQLKEKELRTDVSKRGKGGKGKGIASHVKKTIIELVNCTYARLDGWIKLGKAIAPFVDEYGLGVLGLIPHEISDHR
jgi:hypothetical protein